MTELKPLLDILLPIMACSFCLGGVMGASLPVVWLMGIWASTLSTRATPAETVEPEVNHGRISA